MRVIANNKKTEKTVEAGYLEDVVGKIPGKEAAETIIKGLLNRFRGSGLETIIFNVCQAMMDESQRQPGPGDIFEEKARSND
jgi:hypothetical protein